MKTGFTNKKQTSNKQTLLTICEVESVTRTSDFIWSMELKDLKELV